MTELDSYFLRLEWAYEDFLEEQKQLEEQEQLNNNNNNTEQ